MIAKFRFGHCSPSITYEDAIRIRRWRALGETQHHIAQRLGVNQGRVNEVLKERKHVGSRSAAFENVDDGCDSD